MKTPWEARWYFAADANGDGAVTISDVWEWVLYVFFAPGDLLLLWIMGAPDLARFLELDASSLQGWGSGFISACVWVAFLSAISSLHDR